MSTSASWSRRGRCLVTVLAQLRHGVMLVALAFAIAGPAAGEPKTRLQAGVLECRGEGGWGGERGPSGPQNVPPDRDPDHQVTYQTSPDQALVYRLSGRIGLAGSAARLPFEYEGELQYLPAATESTAP